MLFIRSCKFAIIKIRAYDIAHDEIAMSPLTLILHKIDPRGFQHYIFGDYFYSKKAGKLRFPVFLHFNARKHMISSFYLK